MNPGGGTAAGGERGSARSGGFADGESGYKRLRRLGIRILVQAVLAALLLEIGLRAMVRAVPPIRRLCYAAYDVPDDAYRSARTLDELLAQAPTPVPPFSRMHGFVFNSRGLRTGEYAAEKARGARRVVLLGDSFLIAGGYSPEEKQVAAALKGALSRKAPTEVINLGTPGVGTLFYSRMLEVEGLRLKPDAVVVAFFVGNDITDEWAEYAHFGRPAWLEREAALARSFLVYRCFRNAWRLFMWPPRGGQELPRDAEASARGKGGYPTGEPVLTDHGTFDEEAYLRIELSRSLVFESPAPPGLDARMGKVADILAGMKGAADKAGARMLVMLIPDEAQVNPAVQDAIRKAKPGVEYDFERPQAVLRRLLGDRGVACIDLLPEFRSLKKAGRNPFLIRNTHWSGYGQEIAGEALARKVERLLEGPGPGGGATAP